MEEFLDSINDFILKHNIRMFVRLVEKLVDVDHFIELCDQADTDQLCIELYSETDEVMTELWAFTQDVHTLLDLL